MNDHSSARLAAHDAEVAVPRPSLGRIVLFVLPAGKHEGQVRPAIVTRCWPVSRINAHVFLDGVNDHGLNDHAYTVDYSAEPIPGTWHWPPRV